MRARFRPTRAWVDRLTPALARVVLPGRPATEVAAVVDGERARWRNPANGTDEVLAGLGLPPVGPLGVVVTRDPGTC